MNIKLLDKNYNVLGELDNFYSLIWHRKYFDVGRFQLVMAPEPILQETRYLYRSDADETGRVDKINPMQDETGATQFMLSGRFLEGILDDRIIIPVYTTTTSKQAGTVIRDLITRNIISPSDIARKIGNVRIGTVAATDTVAALQVTYDNLKQYVYELCLQVGCSIRAAYDFDTDEIVFEVWTGKDRTQDQSANSWAVFSDTFDNINQIDYYRDTENYKNFVYVAGEGEGSARIVETLNEVGTGEDRRELYVDARDLRMEDENQQPISEVNYRKILKQRGKEKKSSWTVIENVDCEISVYNQALVYKQDYDLGDICTVQYNKLGITVEKRITECIETWEDNSLSVNTIFGEDTLNFWNVSAHK